MRSQRVTGRIAPSAGIDAGAAAGLRKLDLLPKERARSHNHNVSRFRIEAPLA